MILISTPNDEDNLISQPHTSRWSTPATTNRFTPLPKSQTSASMAGTTVQVGNNKKYPDVPLFYGNGINREKWEGCRLHLESKFRQSAVLYTCEQDKIDYIRNHCKNTAFEVIKAKANPASANAYLTASTAYIFMLSFNPWQTAMVCQADGPLSHWLNFLLSTIHG